MLALFREIERKLEGHTPRQRDVSPVANLEPVVDLRIFELAVQAYRRSGTPKRLLDSQNLTDGQRAELYDKVVWSEKGRKPKNNPYR